jgi:hypothetical protein
MILPRAGHAQSSMFIPFGTNGIGSSSKLSMPPSSWPVAGEERAGEWSSGSEGETGVFCS